MARRFDLVVFDWDGTLLDSPAAIVHAIRQACVDIGIEPPEDRLARQVIGLGLRDALGTAVPQLPIEHYPRLAERYRHHYLSRDAELTLFPGAIELLQGLEEGGHRLAVATGKSRLGLQRALAHAGLERFFHATRCADECHSKPHPQMLLEIMDELGVAADRTVMIGDTTHDLQMAGNAGVASLGVCFGAHCREDLVALAPLACLDSISELREWLIG